MSVIANKGAKNNFEQFDDITTGDKDKSLISMTEDPKELRSKVYKLLVALGVAVCLSIVLLSVLLWAVTSKKGYVPPPEEGFVSASASLRSNMDLEAEPCDDFYQYACGGWMKKHVIPDDSDNWSNFVILRDETAVTILNLVNSFIADTKDPKPEYLTKLLNFYESCMNTTVLDAASEDTIKESVLAVLDSASKADTIQLVAQYNLYLFYVLYVDPDSKNPTENSVFMIQGALGLSLKGNYNATDTTETDQQTSYKNYLKQLWIEYGKTDSDAEAIVGTAYGFEECVADGMNSPDEERAVADDMPSKSYAEVKAEDFASTLLIEEALSARTSDDVTINDATKIFYLNPYITATNACVANHLADIGDFNNYVATRLMLKYAGSGKQSWRDLNWAYQQAITKVEVKPAQWKTCLSKVTGYMPETVGRIFSEEAFHNTAKDNTLAMIEDIKTAFKSILPELTWMDSDTREYAIEKAEAVKSKIGYPNWILNETSLNTYLEDLILVDDDILTNTMHGDMVLTKKTFDGAGKDVDEDKWYMSPATVNAYYNPKGNEMVFPAAILQPPFYHESYPTYVNYGAIGVVIGHELTHGFDDSGRKYDKAGYLRQWYTDDAVQKFQERAQCLVNQYGEYVIADSPVNGNLTLGENIADNGGVKQAYIAYQNWVARNGKEQELPGLDLTNEQAFFLSYAQIWCQKKTKEAFKVMTASDPHSPGMFRVKGPLVNSKEFAAAYNCDATKKMNPPDKCEVW